MSTQPIPVFFTNGMVADLSPGGVPSARKPLIMAKALKESGLPIQFIEPRPLTVNQIALAHAQDYVEDVMAGRRENGFGNTSLSVRKSLPYTNGAMVDAAVFAFKHRRHACALASGFHHAGYRAGGGYCTFNGLMIAVQVLLQSYGAKRIAIIDADQHYGDGTQGIINELGLEDRVFHYSFGRDFFDTTHADDYLKKMRSLAVDLSAFKPEVILYQAGADAHRDDPLGGVLTTEQLKERDAILFSIARELGVGVAWNLAGGYQVDEDGGISKVVEVHLNTYRIQNNKCI